MQRVLFLRGRLAIPAWMRGFANGMGHRSQPSGSLNQAAALEAEGVTVTTGALGELMVDFAEFGWFPRILPSEAAQGLSPHIDEDEE